jgi:hypothetical protein
MKMLRSSQEAYHNSAAKPAWVKKPRKRRTGKASGMSGTTGQKPIGPTRRTLRDNFWNEKFPF